MCLCDRQLATKCLKIQFKTVMCGHNTGLSLELGGLYYSGMSHWSVFSGLTNKRKTHDQVRGLDWKWANKQPMSKEKLQKAWRRLQKRLALRSQNVKKWSVSETPYLHKNVKCWIGSSHTNFSCCASLMDDCVFNLLSEKTSSINLHETVLYTSYRFALYLLLLSLR